VGCGRNQPLHRRRTHGPSAHEWHEIDVYVATSEGLYLYDAVSHALQKVSGEDIRSHSGLQPFVADAPVNLVYVADHSKMIEADERDRILYAAAATGAISQNVCLFCASEGLGTVVRALVDREHLATMMKLNPTQHIVLAQSVGYPASTIPA